MKIKPIQVTITTSEQLDALIHALEVSIDITADTVTDDIPWTAEDIRSMAQMSDAEIKNDLNAIHNSVNEKITAVESLRDLYAQVKGATAIGPWT